MPLDAPSSAPAPYRVLFLCTGNVCRSPLAERVLRARLAARGADAGVEVASAGTHALVGAPMEPPAAAIVAREGGAADGHVARALTPALLRDVDLVLALSREHRSAAVRERPALVRRAFTLREAGRLAAVVPGPGAGGSERDGPAARWAALVAALSAARGSLPAPAEGADDVIDPYRASDAVYAQSAAQVLPALDAIVDALLR